MNLWPHQEQGIRDVLDAIQVGERRICLTSPTGCGKSLMMRHLIEHHLERGKKVVLYSNRKLLIEQLRRTFAGIAHGVRAAGYGTDRERPFQISSIQTEYSRVMKRKTWSNLHEADLVIVDEGHLHTGPSARAIMDAHHEAGAAIVLVTATPLGMGEVCSLLLQAGTVSQGRACGALVPCIHYGPDEPDLKEIGKRSISEDISEEEARSLMGKAGTERFYQLSARVIDWFDKINPQKRPSILFAPGVPESIGFAEEFTATGTRAAHIDGAQIWLDGNFHESTPELRAKVLEGSRDGSIKLLCNRFVLREGIDCPWLAHGVFATVFGGLQSYLQSGGRLLRSYPGIEAVTLQDHGGNWWRHGSLNADREWSLDYTSHIAAGMREEKLRAKVEAEPLCCPKCARILTGLTCLGCGFQIQPGQRSRKVVQKDGSLKEHNGDIFKPKRVLQKPNTCQLWAQCYYRAKNSGKMTFRQAEALFVHENHYWPPRTLPLMPVQDLDWYRRVRDVPKDRLRA